MSGRTGCRQGEQLAPIFVPHAWTRRKCGHPRQPGHENLKIFMITSTSTCSLMLSRRGSIESNCPLTSKSFQNFNHLGEEGVWGPQTRTPSLSMCAYSLKTEMRLHQFLLGQFSSWKSWIMLQFSELLQSNTVANIRSAVGGPSVRRRVRRPETSVVWFSLLQVLLVHAQHERSAGTLNFDFMQVLRYRLLHFVEVVYVALHWHAYNFSAMRKPIL